MKKIFYALLVIPVLAIGLLIRSIFGDNSGKSDSNLLIKKISAQTEGENCCPTVVPDPPVGCEGCMGCGGCGCAGCGGGMCGDI